MRIKKLSVVSFRNLIMEKIEPGERFNIFYGRNGQGKTNLLEAIYLLGTLKSFRGARNSELISWGEKFSKIGCRTERQGVDRDIAVLIEPEGKRVRLDGKAPSGFTDFFGSLNVVVFFPDELAMTRGEPLLRRKYLDRAVFAARREYLPLYREYAAILRNRNALLRSGRTEGLDVWTEKLAQAGGRMVALRVSYVETIAPLLARYYRDVSGTAETASLSYAGPSSLDAEEATAQLALRLRTVAGEELRRGVTLAGPHRDDLVFGLEGRNIGRHGSQGQKRTYVLALKMAEIESLTRMHGTAPVLLLDDIASELDSERNANLIRFLEGRGMQVFISTTAAGSVSLHGSEQYRIFRLENGKVIPE